MKTMKNTRNKSATQGQQEDRRTGTWTQETQGENRRTNRKWGEQQRSINKLNYRGDTGGKQNTGSTGEQEVEVDKMMQEDIIVYSSCFLFFFFLKSQTRSEIQHFTIFSLLWDQMDRTRGMETPVKSNSILCQWCDYSLYLLPSSGQTN